MDPDEVDESSAIELAIDALYEKRYAQSPSFALMTSSHSPPKCLTVKPQACQIKTAGFRHGMNSLFVGSVKGNDEGEWPLGHHRRHALLRQLLRSRGAKGHSEHAAGELHQARQLHRAGEGDQGHRCATFTRHGIVMPHPVVCPSRHPRISIIILVPSKACSFPNALHSSLVCTNGKAPDAGADDAGHDQGCSV